MANINVGELIIVTSLPTQIELNNKSITVDGITKTFEFPVVFRTINGAASVDYTYLNAVDEPTSSFNSEYAFLDILIVEDGILESVKKVLKIPQGVTTVKGSVPVPGNFDIPAPLSDKLIAKVIFPKSLNTIEKEAFRGNKIESISFNQGLSIIGDSAFFGNKLNSVIFPQTMTYIGHYAFSTNPLLTLVTLPSTCTYEADSFDIGVNITGGELIQ